MEMKCGDGGRFIYEEAKNGAPAEEAARAPIEVVCCNQKMIWACTRYCMSSERAGCRWMLVASAWSFKLCLLK